MERSRESWAKVGAMTASACLIGGFYFGALKTMDGLSDLNRSFLSIAGLGLVGCISSFMLKAQKREGYFATLIAILVLLTGGAVFCEKFIRPAISAAASGVVYDMNYLDGESQGDADKAEDGQGQQQVSTPSQKR